MRSMICSDTATTPTSASRIWRYAARYAGQYARRASELSQSSRPK